MSNPKSLSEKYRHIKAHKDAERTERLQHELAGSSRYQMEGLYAGTAETGHAYLQHSAGEVNCVLETVQSLHGDSVSVLYVGDPLFAERKQYIAARKELIDFVNDVSGDMLVQCKARGRFVWAKELSLAQLIDQSTYLLDRFNGRPTAKAH